MRYAQVVVSVLTALAGAACGEPTAPEFTLAFAITDSVEARRSPNEVRMTIGIQLTNHDDRIVFYSDCGHALQKRDQEHWQTVWSPSCAYGSSIALNPGESRLFTFAPRAAVTTTEWPAVNAAGEYRVVLWLTEYPHRYDFAPRPLGPASRTSPVFGVREVVVVF